MRRKTTFSLEPYYPESKRRFMSIDFDVVVGGDIYNPINPVLQTLPVKKIDYGKLFTYAFRRFGLPNAGSDGYKEIANWYLKTPLPDLLLIIRPTPLEEPHFSIRFCVPEELSMAYHHWERADIDAWNQRKLDWAEKQGLPEWMPALTAKYAEEMMPGATWRDLYMGYIIMKEPHSNHTPEGDPELLEFAAKVAKFREIESCPGFRKREPDLSLWSNDDPKKPLAFAAIKAIADLKTGVRVRDTAINAFGKMADGEGQVVNEPEGAGNTLGPMFNDAPDECIELQTAAHKLGGGHYKAGLNQILNLIKEDIQKSKH